MKAHKTLHFSFRNIAISFVCSFIVLGVLWLFCAFLQQIGCPFPVIQTNKFFDLGFFALSNFSFITFLAMSPFQAAEGQLSPGFFATIINRPWSHFGLYLLVSCFVACFFIVSCENLIPDALYIQLYMAIVGAVIFAIIFHLVHTLRYLYQPVAVYENLAKLADEERIEELWLDLYECTFKAIKAHRLGNARSFIDLMSGLYKKMEEHQKSSNLKKDVQSLYAAASEIAPLTAQMESHWPSLLGKAKTTRKRATKKPVESALEKVLQGNKLA